MAGKPLDRGRIAAWSVIGLLVLAVALLLLHSNFVIGRSLLIAFPDWDAQYRAAVPYLDGSVEARGVVLTPPWGDPADAITFDRVRVEMPAWQWYRSAAGAFGALLPKSLRSMRRAARGHGAIRNVRIALDGGRGIGGIGYTRELAAVGTFSASPFEAEGCVQDTHWTRDELAGMGLAAGPTRFHMEIDALVNERHVTQRIETPGVGRVEYRGRIATPDGGGAFDLGFGERDALAADGWTFVDLGFVAARNRYCAELAAIGEEEFVRRHLLAVERLMASVAIAPDEALRDGYRSFVLGGGEFAYAVEYRPQIHSALLDRDELASWVPRMRGGARRGGERLGVGLVAVPQQALPDDGWETTHELLVLEGLIEPPQVAETAPKPISLAGNTITRLNPYRPPVDEAPPPAVLDYAATIARVGERVRLYTVNARPRVVEVLEADGGVLQVRWRTAGGAFEYRVPSDRFLRAELLR